VMIIYYMAKKKGLFLFWVEEGGIFKNNYL